jgi:hypothetical protein
MIYDIEPVQYKGDVVRQNSPSRQRLSEQSNRYQWPPTSDQESSFGRRQASHTVKESYSPTKTMENILDGKRYVGVSNRGRDDKEKSYDEQLFELRSRQKSVTKNGNQNMIINNNFNENEEEQLPAAGIPSNRYGITTESECKILCNLYAIFVSEQMSIFLCVLY